MTKYKLSSKVINKRNYYLIVVEGHSGYAERGKDIVCSSISTLVSMLVRNLVSFNQKIYKLKMEEGIFRLKVEITNESEKLIKTFYEFLEELETQYPDFVKQDDELKWLIV